MGECYSAGEEEVINSTVPIDTYFVYSKEHHWELRILEY